MIWQSLINFSPQQNFSEINKKLILRKEKFDTSTRMRIMEDYNGWKVGEVSRNARHFLTIETAWKQKSVCNFRIQGGSRKIPRPSHHDSWYISFFVLLQCLKVKTTLHILYMKYEIKFYFQKLKMIWMFCPYFPS